MMQRRDQGIGTSDEAIVPHVSPKVRQRIANASARIAYRIVQITNRAACKNDRATRTDDRTGRIADHARGSMRSLMLTRRSLRLRRASYTLVKDSRRDDEAIAPRESNRRQHVEAIVPRDQGTRLTVEPRRIVVSPIRHDDATIQPLVERKRTAADLNSHLAGEHRHPPRCECHPPARRRAVGRMTLRETDLEARHLCDARRH